MSTQTRNRSNNTYYPAINMSLGTIITVDNEHIGCFWMIWWSDFFMVKVLTFNYFLLPCKYFFTLAPYFLHFLFVWYTLRHCHICVGVKIESSDNAKDGTKREPDRSAWKVAKENEELKKKKKNYERSSCPQNSITQNAEKHSGPFWSINLADGRRGNQQR